MWSICIRWPFFCAINAYRSIIIVIGSTQYFALGVFLANIITYSAETLFMN